MIIWGTYEDAIGVSIKEWYFKKTDLEGGITNYVSMGVLKGNTLIGAALFCDYNGSNVNLRYYGPNSVNLTVCRNISKYAFTRLKVNRMTVFCERSNKKLARALSRLGFAYETTLKKYFSLDRSGDAIVYMMTKDHANKYLKSI